MEGEVLCVDDNFSSGQLEFWKSLGVKYPVRDKIYTVRQVVRHTNQEMALRLVEIVNPVVPVKHSVLGISNIEPTFKISRFRTLAGLPIKKEELENVEV